MTNLGLEKGLKSIYLFYGEDRYSIENSVKKIKKLFGPLQKGINYIQIDENSLNQIIPNIETPAFGYEKKLLIVKNSGLFKKDAKKQSNYVEILAKYIKENMEIINQGVCLVFIEETAAKFSMYKVIQENGVVCDFEPLKLFEIVQKLKEICRLYKVNVDDRTLQYLCEISGTDMQNLMNEIRKLIEYVGENGTISKKEIDAVAVKQTESIIFDLTDNLGKRQLQKAIQILKDLIEAKEPVQKILVMLYNHFRKLYIIKIAQREKRNVAESLELKANQAFLVNKYIMQANCFEEKEIRKILLAIIDLDAESKIGNIDLEVGLESILCTYCGK